MRKFNHTKIIIHWPREGNIMRVYNQGSEYRVTCSADDVRGFNATWPCSGLHNAVSFTFHKSTGDMVDVHHPGSNDGEALAALSRDAQAYGRNRLGI